MIETAVVLGAVGLILAVLSLEAYRRSRRRWRLLHQFEALNACLALKRVRRLFEADQRRMHGPALAHAIGRAAQALDPGVMVDPRLHVRLAAAQLLCDRDRDLEVIMTGVDDQRRRWTLLVLDDAIEATHRASRGEPFEAPDMVVVDAAVSLGGSTAPAAFAIDADGRPSVP